MALAPNRGNTLRSSKHLFLLWRFTILALLLLIFLSWRRCTTNSC